jgi:SAM-dependent methyltransferase
VEAPFDALAAEYDRHWAGTAAGALQREQVWRRIDRLWRPGERILELGCGTGIDALHLARRGIRVLATDSAAAMVEQARLRCAGMALVEARQLSAERICSLSECFDGALSNFAALNCVADLHRFAADLAERLRPGSPVALGLFGRHCLWEIAGYLLRGKPASAFRRWRRDPVDASIGQGCTIRVHYHGPEEIRTAFKAGFVLERMVGIGVGVPPTYLHRLVERLPGVFRLCQGLDVRWGALPPFNRLGDHTLYLLRRRGRTLSRTGDRGRGRAR